MRTPTPLALLVALVLAALAALATSSAPAAADGFVLVTSAKAPVKSLSKAEVRALYTGKAKTLAGNAAEVTVRPDTDVPFTQFVDQVFGIPTKALLSKIQQEVFKGEMPKPLKATTDDEVIQHVACAPGRLGVLSQEAAAHLPISLVVILIGG